MEMQEFGIRNFRSFDRKGVYLDDLKQINIFIGKNNSGKSNVLRFIYLLHSHINALVNFPNDIENQHRRKDQPTILVIKIEGFDFPLNKQRSLPSSYDYSKYEISQHEIEYNLKATSFELPEFFNTLNSQELGPFQSGLATAGKEMMIKQIKREWKQKIEAIIKKTFENVVYIPHLRAIQEKHKNENSTSFFDGSNIINRLAEMQAPAIGDEDDGKKFDQIQDFVRELINKPELKIVVPHDRKMITLDLDGNRLPLQSFGTGIHQLVLLCSALVIHDNSIVCIEEPEIHMHPELQRKFIHFLRTTKNFYFITTHSNIFLDDIVNTTLFHVQVDGVRTTIDRIRRTPKVANILDDLGYQSSDVLQSNGVIWVEGPSDRIYIKKWLSLCDDTLIEGLHFSIMFYGGRLLSHLTFEYDEVSKELIPLLKLNRNAFVVMDRDGLSKEVDINKTKKRIKNEIGEGRCWITQGREIENYLTENTLTKWLNVDTITLDENKKLQEIISDVSDTKYHSQKPTMAKKIINYVEQDDLERLDLKDHIIQMVEAIREWNNMSSK